MEVEEHKARLRFLIVTTEQNCKLERFEPQNGKFMAKIGCGRGWGDVRYLHASAHTFPRVKVNCAHSSSNSSPKLRPASTEGGRNRHTPVATFVATKGSSSPSRDRGFAILSGLGMYSAQTQQPNAPIKAVARKASRETAGTCEPALTKQAPAAWLSTNHMTSRPRMWSATIWNATRVA